MNTDVQGGPRHHDRWVIIPVNGRKYMGKWGEETLVVEVIISSENWYRGPPRIRFS